jgi:hypothetical protein
MTRRKACLYSVLVGVLAIFTAAQTSTGHYFFWRIGLQAIDADVLLDYCQDYEDIPALIGMPIEKAKVSMRGIFPASIVRVNSYNPSKIFPDCDEYYWIIPSQVLIGVKNGKIIKTGLVKG